MNLTPQTPPHPRCRRGARPRGGQALPRGRVRRGRGRGNEAFFAKQRKIVLENSGRIDPERIAVLSAFHYHYARLYAKTSARAGRRRSSRTRRDTSPPLARRQEAHGLLPQGGVLGPQRHLSD
jgi:hypothetical protein